MRALTQAQRDAIADPEGHWTFAYLEVKDFDGTWHNLGALAAASYNLFSGCTLADDIDKHTLSMTATMVRESGIYSLSPFMTGSPLNALADFTYSPLLDLHREWRIMVALVAQGVTPTAPGDYREMASGIVDRIDIAGDPAVVTIQGRGREADLMDAMIATGDRTYGDDALTEDLGDTAQAMVDDQMGTGVVPITFNPAAPAFALSEWTQEETQLFPAVSDAVALSGAVIRYKYDASDVHTLTIFEPDRAAAVEDWEIADTEYEALDVGIDLSGVRNYVPVKYVDSTTGAITTVISPAAEAATLTSVAGAATFSATQAGVLVDGAIIVVAGVAHVVSAFDGTTGCTLSGVPTYTAVDWHTSASITRYGLRSIPIDLSAETQVVTSASAQSLADNVRSDLEYPLIEQSLKGSGLWFAELGDYVKTVANGVHYDEDQYGGITTLHHAFADGHLTTTLGLRGQPAGRYRTWLTIGGGGAVAATMPLTLEATLTPNATNSAVDIELTAHGMPGEAIEVYWENMSFPGIIWQAMAAGFPSVTPLVVYDGDTVPAATWFYWAAGLDWNQNLLSRSVTETPSPLPRVWGVGRNGRVGISLQISLPYGAPGFTSLTSGTSITWTTGGARSSSAALTLAHNATLTIANVVDGAEGYLEVTQDGTGGRTLALPAGTIVGSTTTIHATANKKTSIAWSYNGSAYTFVLARES
jgi:hypothetical protein